jgi:hypothetical protein
MVNRNGLNIVDKGDLCTGPRYTFFVEGVGESYVDHIILSAPLLSLIKDCSVLEDTLDNTSDHLAITIKIRLDNLPCAKYIPSPCRIKWAKLSKEQILDKYTNLLNGQLSDTFPEVDGTTILSIDEVSEIIDLVIRIINEVSKPLKSKFNKFSKPYWNKNLTYLSKHEKSLWHQWKQLGSPEMNLLYICNIRKLKNSFAQNKREPKGNMNYNK